MSTLDKIRRLKEQKVREREVSTGEEPAKKPSGQGEASQEAQIVTISKSKTTKMGLDDALKVFGHAAFREGQREAIVDAMEGKDGVLCVFPTGAGKSLVYQIPSLMSDNLTVVVSPLISLMKDQVDKLQSLGINAILINSSLPLNDAKIALAEVSSGGVRALYVSPERFGNPEFNRTIEKLKVDIFAVDEAHCFLGDTMVSTPFGRRRIDSLRVGDEVITRWGLEPVVSAVSRIYLHRGLDVWKVVVGGKEVYCDGGQEFFVKNIGFVSVDRLQCGHEIIIELADGCLRGMRDGEGDAHKKGKAPKQILFAGVPEGWIGENEANRDGKEDMPFLRERIPDETGIQDTVLFDNLRPTVGGEEVGIIGEDVSGQPDEERICQGCRVEDEHGDRQIQREKGRERKGSDSCRDVPCQCGEVCAESHCSDGTLPGRKWLSDTLQAGFGVAIGKGCRGSGRPVSQGVEDSRIRQAQGVVFGIARVESVSRVERGSTLTTGERLGENPAGVRFYDIEVDGTHKFFANGILAKNCISRWGNDFRPSYAELGGVIERLNPRQVVALTATATERVREDICRSLHIEKAARFIQSVYRPNLQLAMVLVSPADRYRYILTVAKSASTGIVYATTRREVEAISSYLCKKGVQAAGYHAGLPPNARTEIQNQWSQNGGIIVATSAFGMGIDRPDVRFVVHVGLSPSIEDWFQECGRAGRDGEDALCLTVCDFENDYRTQVFLIDMTNPSGKDVEGFWKWLKSEATKAAKGAPITEIGMTQKAMEEESGFHNVGACISVLKQKGLVKTLGRGNYQVRLDLNDTFDLSQIDGSRKDRLDKLNALVNFYRDKECRFEYVCGYFGDVSLSGPCKKCDNCNS